MLTDKQKAETVIEVLQGRVDVLRAEVQQIEEVLAPLSDEEMQANFARAFSVGLTQARVKLEEWESVLDYTRRCLAADL